MFSLNGKPFISKLNNFNSFMNEAFILVYLLALMGISDFNSEMEDKEGIGLSPTITIGCNFIVSFVKFVINTS